MPCFVMTSIVGVLLAAVLLCQYILPLELSPAIKTGLGLLFALCAVSPILIPIGQKIIGEKLYVFYYHGVLFLFITVVILFNYTVIADIAVIIGHFLKSSLIPSLTNRHFINKINACAVINRVIAIFQRHNIAHHMPIFFHLV